jgi:hypothetical protein
MLTIKNLLTKKRCSVRVFSMIEPRLTQCVFTNSYNIYNELALLHRQVKTTKVVMPDLIRHPVFSMDSGFRRNDGNSAGLSPE